MKARFELAKPLMGNEEWQAVREVIETGWITQGAKVSEFEQAVARACGAPHAVAVSSCSAALYLSLICAGIGAGDEVIVPSMSFIATANAILQAQAVPVFAEVCPDTFNLDPLDVVKRIGPRTRAILLVHQLGLPAELDAFREIAKSKSIVLIEDAACALGSEYAGAPIGTGGEFVCFSFHPRKVITTGEGGMVLTNSALHAARLRSLRQHGADISDLSRHNAPRVTKEQYTEAGFNFRMTDLQAAIGIVQLGRLPGIIQARKVLAEHYNELLEGQPSVRPPVVPDRTDWNVQTYAIRLTGAAAPQRNQLMQFMYDRGIATRPGVMTAHREPVYQSIGHWQLPVSEQASDSSMMLPLYPTMLPEDCLNIAQALSDGIEMLV